MSSLLLSMVSISVITVFSQGEVAVGRNLSTSLSESPSNNLPYAHIILIVIDAVRPDVLLEANTPNFDALTAEGSYTWNAWTVTPSITIKAVPSIYTGATPEVHGVTDWEGEIYAETLTEVFNEAGLTSAIVGNDNILGGYSATYCTGYYYHPEADKHFTDIAIEWFINYRPFFLTLYNPMPDRRGHAYGHESAEYRESIENADYHVGRLAQAIKDLGVYDNTLIVITTDHGMTGTSHGYGYENDMRIFSIWRGPRVKENYQMANNAYIPPSATYGETYVAHRIIDIAPTITALAGSRAPENSEGSMIYQIFEGLVPRAPIHIVGNDNFTATNGVVGGSGTENDPYIIENWVISAENAHGIEIRDTTAHFIVGNCFVHDGLVNYKDGILFENVINGIVENNIVGNNSYGLCLYYSDNNLISGNIVENNDYGLYLYYDSYNNLIYHNNFISNAIQAYDNGFNRWDNGYPSGGNYWSDYTGVDDYSGENQDIPGSDGIGDTPYIIPGDNNRDRYPLMSPVGLRTEIITIYPIADVYAFGRYSRPQLKFNINSIPAGADIISAKLWLYRLAADNWDGNVTVYRVDNQLWDETVTPGEFDAQILTNGENQSNKFMLYGWDYLDVLDQVEVDYEVGNTYASFRLRWANDNGSEPSIGVDDGRFLAIESESDNLEVVLCSSEYNGRDPCLEVVYVPPYAVSVSISPTYNSGAPTEVLSYTVTVKNIGNLDDNYILTASDNTGWGPTVSPTPLFVASGSTGEATLTVTVPENTKFCTMDNITVTATSQSDNTVSDNAWCLAHAAMVRGVEISISPSYQSDLPGENLEYMVAVRNLGNIDDDYDLIAQDTENWCLSIASSIMVPAFENRTTVLTVTIPDNVMGCTLDNVTVTATSQENENVSDSESCLAHVKVLPGVDVQIEPGWQENFYGENLTYTVTVINTGNARDNYILTAEDIAGWGLTFSDNLVNDNRIENLAPGENRIVTLTVTIRESPGYYKEDDNITVTATSTENAEISDDAICTGHGISWTGWARLWLENLYKVGLEKDLQLYAGRKLVVKFYKYDSITFQAENVIHNFTPRENIKENENAPQPREAEGFSWGTVQVAKLVLTTDNTEEVISTIASFTVHQSHLKNRTKTILREWGGHPELHDAFRAEYKDILRQWGGAPP